MNDLTTRLLKGPAVADPPIVRACVNCAHFMPDCSFGLSKQSAMRFARCIRPVRVSPITGKPEAEEVSFCSVERQEYFGLNNCGHSGRFWKLKPPEVRKPSLLKRLFSRK